MRRRHGNERRQSRRQKQALAAQRKGWQVVSTKMQKTIVVEVEMRKAHPKYKRIMKSYEEVLRAR